jgi:hypothetical protein
MRMIRYGLIAAVVIGIAIAGAAYAGWLRLPTDFSVGHTPAMDGSAMGAPPHSGG